MKKLLLALLVSGTAILAASQPAPVSANCVAEWYRYFQYPGGPACGSTAYFCDGSVYQNGCTTPYFQYYIGCTCP